MGTPIALPIAIASVRGVPLVHISKDKKQQQLTKLHDAPADPDSSASESESDSDAEAPAVSICVYTEGDKAYVAFLLNLYKSTKPQQASLKLHCSATAPGAKRQHILHTTGSQLFVQIATLAAAQTHTHTPAATSSTVLGQQGDSSL